MQFWRRSIQWQLILSMGTALLVSILIVVGIYTLVVNRLAERYLVEQALPSSIEAMRNDIERILVQPLTAAKDIASNSMVRDWLVGGENSAQTNTFVTYLEGIRSEHKAFTAIIVGTASNHYFTEKGLDRTLSRSNPKDAWFYAFLDSNQPRTLNIDNDTATGELALFIDFKVEQAGKVVGVAGLGLSMKELSELIHNFNFGERGKVYLVRSDGLIQVHPEAQFSGKRTLVEQIGAPAAQAVMGQKGATSSFVREGEDFLALSLPLRDLGWTLVAEVPQSQIYAEARRAMWMSSGIGLAVALVCLMLVVLLARGLVRPIRQVTAALVAIGSGGGDLTHRLDSSRADELGDLARGFNRFLESQRDMIGEVLTTSERLRTAVGQVARVVDNTAERSGRQQEMTDMVATAVHEMGLTVQEIAQNAGNAAVASQTARDEAMQAREVVGGSIRHIESMSDEIGLAASAVGELAHQVASIDQVLAVIRGISEQTNLLALNAAIEAARAGEAGRGFAVVADEVRNLAHRTQESAEEIHKMITSLQIGSREAVTTMNASQVSSEQSVEVANQAGLRLVSVTQRIGEIDGMNQSVAAATEEQTAVVETLNVDVNQINLLNQQSVANLNETLKDCDALSLQANRLKQLVDSFKI